ncbi:MAG: septum formation inhibitor Maf [Acidobacteria bacterium]|nr:septum formation inhibitor Maf [Acidobacteriota bacterium]MBI3483907.1 septum formation inhibitor Maf [Acidobacteriota bacterium]
MRLILASASPRRAEVLRDASIAFESLPVSVDEARWHDEAPAHLVRRLANAKAAAAAACVSGAAIVLGADTEVVVNGQVLGKPAGMLEAREMLRSLSGRVHKVITGLELIRLPDRAARSGQEVTLVTFAPLSAEEINTYVSTGEPFDKAGGYAIQGRAGRFITRVEGCYFNVVGLPLSLLYRALLDFGWSPD